MSLVHEKFWIDEKNGLETETNHFYNTLRPVDETGTICFDKFDTK